MRREKSSFDAFGNLNNGKMRQIYARRALIDDETRRAAA